MSGEIPPAIGDFPAGSQIAGYQIDQLIGRGGMASVYRATDIRLDRMVALKVLTPQLARDDAFRQRFIRESRSSASVDHPNVIPVFEAGEADGVLFIAMRYVTGRDVRALIDREGRLPAGRVVNIVTQVGSALDAAHAHGLIHRDVKPANMLLATVASGSTPDHVYLSDFGLSKMSVSAVSLTGTGQFLGTLDYMSPEQVEGRPVDGRTDLYALGCAAFEMLTGEPPFRREQDLAVMWAQVSASPPSVRALRPDLPPQVDDVLAKALAKAPASRQTSCLEFAAELKAACTSRSGAGRPAQPVVPAQPGRPATELASFGPAAAQAAAGSGAVLGGAGSPAPGMPPVNALTPGFDATVTEAAIGAGAGGSGYGAGAAGGGGGAPGPTRQTSYDSPTGAQYGQPQYDQAQYGQPQHGQGQQYGQGQYGQGGGQPGQPGQQWPGQPGYSQPPRKRRGKALPVLAGLLVVAVLAGAAVLVLHLRAKGSATPKPTVSTRQSPSHSASASSSPSPTTATSSAPVTPGAVVTGYYNDINNHQYRLAYRINEHIHASQSFPDFRQGYADTEHVALTIVSVSGDSVSVDFSSTHTDGSVMQFQGTYTVQNGLIVDSHIEQTG